ncbi:AsmA family protein [Panacagrimonas sp.]|uniref:AsmA family protein n=1 Tax=Panacagrimonas sp. TaxID=2480088 RepID=UPI003B519112
MRSSKRRWMWVLGLPLAILLVLVLAWDWNWIKPWVERQAGAALGREVRIAELDLHGWRRPTLVASGIEVKNPADFPGQARFGSLDRLEVTIDPAALLDRTVALTRIHLEKPQLALFAPPEGAPNWVLPSREAPSDPAAFELSLGQLSIAGGEVHVLHPALKSDFKAQIATRPGEDAGPPSLHIDADGSYAGQPIRARFVGGSLLSLREESDPYPVFLEVVNGPTQLSLKGTVLDPLKLGGARLALRLQGADMAALYPLTGVPLPQTAPFEIEGKFGYLKDASGSQFRFREFSGTVGSSDLSGDLAVRTGGPRLKITGEMRSDSVLLSDLGGFVGAAPGEGTDGMTAEQKAERTEREASPRLLPDTPINLPKLRGADFDLRYTAKRIQSADTPLDDLFAQLRIDDGVLSLRPIKFGVGGGAIAANLRLDGTRDLAQVQADADFQSVDFGKVLSKTLKYRGAGKIDGRMNLDASGNSVADLLADGDGKLRLSMAGGDVSALLINLAGLDFGNALLSALGIPSRAELRCMVVDADLADGLLKARTLLLDTTEANVVGTGSVNLKTEQVDLRVVTQPKTFNIGSAAAPINVSGPLKNPNVRPDASSLALRGGAAIALGIVATPLAALIPTIQLGRGKDVDCDALLKVVRSEAAKLPRTPEPAKPAEEPVSVAP